MTEEDFLELFKYTGPEVIPGEFFRACEKIYKNIFQLGFKKGENKGWYSGVKDAEKIIFGE